MCHTDGVVKTHCGAKEVCFLGWAKDRRLKGKREVVKQPLGHSQNWEAIEGLGLRVADKGWGGNGR